MELDELDSISKNQLAEQYRREGLVVLSGVRLPAAFHPPATDVIFLRGSDAACEVYIQGSVTYLGADPEWLQSLRGQECPGGTRHIATVRGDFFTGLHVIQEHMARAAEAGIPLPADDLDAPLPEDEGREREPERCGAEREGRSRLSQLRDLVEASRRNPRRLVGREDLLKALKTSLLRQEKPGVVLLGHPGVGKTSIVEMLAADMAGVNRVPSGLRNTPIYELPLGALVEQSRYVGDIERRARQALEAPGRPIFFADEIHQLARNELRPLCDILKPALATGAIRMIGATTPTDWRSLGDRAFKRRFLELAVDEPTPEEAFHMVRERAKTLAEHHEIVIDEIAVREAIILAARYLPMRYFPDKAIDLLDHAAAMQVAAGSEDPSTERGK